MILGLVPAGGRQAARAFLLGCLAVITSAACAAAEENPAKPRRIVSLNMCTDELVLRLADRQAITSVTWLSQDPRNANMAAIAETIPANHGLVEQVLSHKPDLVIAGAYTTRTTVALLKRVGATVREFGVPRNIAAMRAQIEEMAALLGEPARGAALVAEIDARLARLAAEPRPSRAKALVLRPNGFTVGRGSLVDEILTRAGLVNRAAELGIDNYGQIALETVVLGEADLLILNTTPDGPPSLAHEILHHPVLMALGSRVKLVALPSRLWTCAGPAVIDAIELLRRAAAADGEGS
ncbi:ABC transporter substrate-binding protein [Bosea sp. 124]|uniref:ABC transporter substrate-binding protein n=1 Tax=Bosea sp. 124 TaxID=2135642 RepID=UPI000D4CC0CE|nr:ABC transporter substrate-binding protein [Bosea sp. 124]PTM39786.1 iron complex transport system substrate-binding protein [Bosea sp. 124]